MSNVMKKQGAPSVSTFGDIGDYYIDTRTDKIYKCVDIRCMPIEYQFVDVWHHHPDRTEYIWEEPGGGGPVITDFNRFCYENARLNDLDRIDTSNGTNFSAMFYNCSITSIPELDTSNGTDFSYMFEFCSITSIPELDTSNGTNFRSMFLGCAHLTSIPELNTSNGTIFASMFDGCSSLTSIPELDVSNGTNFSRMFASCNKLTSIPKLDVLNGTDFSYMFNFCTSLKDLYLYNIRKAIQIGSGTSWGNLLTVDSLVHTIKELCKVTTSTTLTMGSANKEKIANLYCKVIDDTTEKIEMELCESTDEGAMTLEEYAAEKGWTIA